MGSFLPSDRQRKDELEQRMSALQESRRELMVQLEGLMKLLKVRTCVLSSRCLSQRLDRGAPKTVSKYTCTSVT